MKQCPNCGQPNDLQAAQCIRCGTALPPPMPPVPGPPAAPQQGPAPGFVPSASAPPGFAPRPPAFLPWQRPFTWKDLFAVLGFVAGVVGYFFASVLLLPLGLASSIAGFRGERCRGLAVAGIVTSAIGMLLKLMVVLEQAALLPDWFTNGIW